MVSSGLLPITVFFVILVILAKPLGLYIARVFENKFCGLDFVFKPLERLIYRVCGVDHKQEMDWQTYALSVLLFSIVGFIILYGIQRLQSFLPLNPQSFSAIKPNLAFNIAVSYITNTDWQPYAGENILSYFTQAIGLTVQNFLSAATGMAVLMVFIRGFARHETSNIGNFWVDLTRGTLYVLLPLSLILAVALVSQGIIQNYKPYSKVQLVQPIEYSRQEGSGIVTLHEQVVPMGPVASQVAIKQLGSNGGGFFGVNSAHPFENPTPLSNFLELLAVILIPASLCFTFGAMIKDPKQGRAVFIVMAVIFLLFLFLQVKAEQMTNPLLNPLNIDQTYGNMEGKETRFGVIDSAIWTTTTTAAANGAVNSNVSSFMPLGGFIPMLLMQFDEVVFGGVGSGLCGMLIFVILTVFIAGLMIGRTPEYLGKKIGIFEMKMASLTIIIPLLSILVCTALGVANKNGTADIVNRGAHGFSEILYAFSSVASNNGSNFSRGVYNSFYNITTGLVMLCSRWVLIFSTLAMAGALAHKKLMPQTKGTMLTDTPLFIGLTIVVILVVGSLAFLPALALGPIVEHLAMFLKH